MPDVYVIAPLGMSPAVLTETLWFLTVVERHRVLGVELWVTDADDGNEKTALHKLRSMVSADLWGRLRRAAGPAADRLPELPERFVARPPSPSLPVIPGLTVFRFERDGRPLPDVRDAADARVVAEQLHARVRFLCGALGDIVLIGSVAGGRKNFGASLQGAFELQARPGDRLVHVLVHERIEADPKLFFPYIAPEEPVAGVPVEEQLTVFDIPFPPLRHLIAQAEWARALDRDDAVSLWARLRANLAAGREAHARLLPAADRRWRLEVTSEGQVADAVELTGGGAEMFAALVSTPPHVVGVERWAWWADHMHRHRRARERDGAAPADEEAVRKRLSELRIALLPLRDFGFGAFAMEGNGVDAHIPAAARVRLDD